MTIIAPSLLSADFLHLSEEIDKFNHSKALWLHYDVMDGNFVPNLSFGPGILQQVNKQTDKFIDVHIMVDNPLETIDYFNKCKVDMITFHYEAVKNVEQAKEVIDKIHAKGIKAGISVKPKTKVEEIETLLSMVDLALVMSVEPGFGGQKFMSDMLDKCDWLADYRQKNDLHYLIEIDGGINDQTGKLAKAHHCDVLVAGSYCFNNPNGFDASVESLLDENE